MDFVMKINLVCFDVCGKVTLLSLPASRDLVVSFMSFSIAEETRMLLAYLFKSSEVGS